MKTNTEKYIHYGFLVLVFFTPLIFLPQIDNLYTLPKECLVRVVISFLLMILALEKLSSDEWQIRFSPLGLPILLYLVALSFSLFNAINPYTGVYEVLRRTTYILLFFLVINHVKDERDITNICGAAVGAGLLVSLLGVFQYFTTFNPDWLYQVVRPSATFGNKNMGAQYVIMVIPLSIALFFESKNQKVKLLWGVATIEMVAYVVYAYSRGSWIGLAGGGFIAIVFFLRRGWSDLNWRLSTKGTSLLLFLLFIHIVLPHIVPTPTKLEVKYSKRVTTAIDLDKGSTRSRLALWANTLDVIKENPMGVGINNWKVVYPKYTRSRMIDKHTTSEKHFINAHNDYIQMISEIGIVGFAFYLWILIYLFRMCWKSIDLKYSPFFLWSMVGFMITSFFSFPLKMPATSLFLWLIAGLVISNRFRTMPQSQLQISNLKTNQSKIRIKIFTISFLSFSLIYLFSVILFSYFQLLSDYHLQRGNMLLFKNKIRDSINPYTRSLELNPWSYWAYFCRGKAHYKLNNFAASARDNLQALRFYPNDINAHGNLGLAYAEQGLFSLAEKEYKKTLSLYPEDSRAHYRLKELEQKKASYLKAKAHYEKSRASSSDSAETWNYRGHLYFLSGALDKAITCYKRAISKDTLYAEAHNNLANAYRKKGLIDEAIEAHQNAIKIDPAFVQAYRNLGKAYEEKGLLKKALRVYLVALGLKSDDADIHFDLGSLFLTRFYDRDRALHHLTRFLQLNPDHIRADQTKETIEILKRNPGS